MNNSFKVAFDGIKAYTDLLEAQLNKVDAIYNQKYDEAANFRDEELKCIDKLPTKESFQGITRHK